VTGAVPFDGKTFNELLFKIVLSDAPLARQLAPHLDPAFEAIISKAMARDVAQRYQTCEEFSEALRAYQVSRGVSLADVTGQVSVPLMMSTPAVSQPAPRVGLSTAANWSNTGMQIPKRSNAPLIAALLGGTLLVLGGGAFAAYKVMHGTEPGAAASAGPSAAVEAKSPPRVVSPPEVSLPPGSPDAAVSVTPSALAPTANKPSEPAAPAKTALRSPVVARVTPRAAPPPAVVAAPPAPAPTPKKKNPSSTTDFGY
jgi:serine/threonine-protein kinase